MTKFSDKLLKVILEICSKRIQTSWGLFPRVCHIQWTCHQPSLQYAYQRTPNKTAAAATQGSPGTTLGSSEEKVRKGLLPGMSAWMKAGACFAGEWTSTAVIQWALATCRVSSLERRSWRNRQRNVSQSHHWQDQREAAWMPQGRSLICLWIPHTLLVPGIRMVLKESSYRLWKGVSVNSSRRETEQKNTMALKEH